MCFTGETKIILFLFFIFLVVVILMTSCKRAPLTIAYVYDFLFFEALDISKIYILLHEQLLKKKKIEKKKKVLSNIHY